MILRRWSDTVLAEYWEDGNPFGGGLIRVEDSTWDESVASPDLGTDVRELTDGGSALTLNRRPRSIPSAITGQEQPAVTISGPPDTTSTDPARVPTVAQTTGR